MTGKEQKVCVYCGDWFECRDHVIPVSYTHARRCFRNTKTVPACKLCNQLLGSQIFSSMEERSAYLFDTVRHRYRRLLKLPVWSQDEIDDLQDGMRSVVETSQHAKRLIAAKLANLNLTSNGQEPVPIPALRSHSEAIALLCAE